MIHISKRDYYKVLGLSKGTSDDEIERVYRKMAKKYHPDINKDPGTEESFKEINETYEALNDPQKKATYDQLGHTGMDGANFGGDTGGFGGFEDFGGIFGSSSGGGSGGGGNRRASNGSCKGNDRFMQTYIESMDAIFGKTETVTIGADGQCDECMGSGTKSKFDIESCSHCSDTGTITTQQRTPFGVLQSQSVCPDCNGIGKTIVNRCLKRHGKGYEHKRAKLDIKVPAGIQFGQQVRVPNKGKRGMNGGLNDDLYIKILVSRHKQFVRDDSDIRTTVSISVVDAIPGCKMDASTVYGDVELTIPADTQFGQQFRLKGKGVKSALSRDGQSDQYVEIKVEVPTKITRDEKGLYEKIHNKKSRESSFGRFKRAFK